MLGESFSHLELDLVSIHLAAYSSRVEEPGGLGLQ